MKKIWNFFRKLAVGLALICWYCAVSTSDYHTLVLKESDPAIVNQLIIAGFVLLIPTVVHWIGKNCKRERL